MSDKIENKEIIDQILHDQRERLKELACINRTSAILNESSSIEEALQKVVLNLPVAWQYPEFTNAKISYENKIYRSPNYDESKWVQSQDFTTIENKLGTIEIFYTKEFEKADEGPFLSEERDLLINISSLITGFINSQMAKDYIKPAETEPSIDQFRKVESSRKLLQRFLEKQNAERDAFHDLMPFKVKEILLVANLYDAYSIEGEGRFTEHILGEYYQLNLSNVPRVTGVSGTDEVIEKLKSRHFDMIIVMMGVEKDSPIQLVKLIKKKYPYIPTLMLVNSSIDLPYVNNQIEEGCQIDGVYAWAGDSKVFFAMVKLLEDRVNAENDTRIGLSSVILLIEDSPEYYSSYLPLIYTLVMEQTKRLIEDVSTDELYKILKMRARPKILLATTFEEAVVIYKQFKDNLLCVISDMRFPKEKKFYDKAGFEFLQFVKSERPNLPTMLQSSDPNNVKYAHAIKSSFINKNSESLLEDLKSFINYYLGFGHFVYRDNKGRKIAVAKSMQEFESYLKSIPEDSLVYHAMKNHFSLWLMARGEVKIAKIISPMKVKDFDSLADLRTFLLDVIIKRRSEQSRGKVVNFDESAAIDETNVVSLAGGSLGGKGRGLAFVNTLIYSFGIGKLIPNINIKCPITAIIGTDEFDMFIETNKLRTKLIGVKDYPALQEKFLSSKLTFTLEKKLKAFLKVMTKPLAIRSSSLFEDSINQPFSGVFGTYLIPNNLPDLNDRLWLVSDAIKLVFASVYSKSARTYFEAINYKIEQEKMAVVIQEVVGNRFEDAFYPHLSGTAQSFNFYPVAHMKPNEGFAVTAVGLGQYVVEGEKAYRFSPVYPKLDIASQKDIIKNAQVDFYAVDMSLSSVNLLEGENAGLIKLEISDAERHGNLKHCASVYNPDNDSIVPGIDSFGPRVVNFANILKYDYIPLAETITTILDLVKEALGTPVEIEYAVDLTKDKKGIASFYLLQIKPMVGSGAGYNIDPESIDRKKSFIITNQSMGNGKINDIKDIIYVHPDNFSNLLTEKMADEIEEFNDEMLKQDKKYILIGPGRWGTQDKFIGVPVIWTQISQAKVIVEVSLPDFPLDASLGSHFFHNVTSMNVGYFSVNHSDPNELIDWDKLSSQKVVKKGKFFTHVSFDDDLIIRMDGKKRMAVIDCPN